MQKFNFYVSYVEVNEITSDVVKFGEINFPTKADTYEEGRAKALEFAQSIARCYNNHEENGFFFKICQG